MAKYCNDINTYKCLSEVRKIKKEGYSLQIIVCMSYDAYKKHLKGENLTQFERFILGLRYSEFYAIGCSSEDYYLAEIKREEFCKSLGFSVEDINKLCKDMCGLN